MIVGETHLRADPWVISASESPINASRAGTEPPAPPVVNPPDSWSFAMMPGMSSTKRRVALVTGSSRGLGSAIAGQLAREGLAVAVNGLHHDQLALEVVDAIRD